jgi:hypothetical protein
MGTHAPVDQLPENPRTAQWSFGLRILFRFVFIYFVLYCILIQIVNELISIPKIDIPDLGTLWPMRQIVVWAATHIFRVGHPLVFFSGSGDKTFDWVEAFCVLVFAVVGMIVWSVWDRKRPNYVTMHKWFRLFIRFALASQMISYGMAKVIPLQMPYPSLARLLEPFGNFSPMGLIWSSIGASRPYEIFAGSMEMVAGIFLLCASTTLFGAMFSAIVSFYIFILNMSYDVPVKLFSFHLILMALVLLAPDLSRFGDFLFKNCPVGPSTVPKLFRTRRANRIAAIAQIALGVWMIGTHLQSGWEGWKTFGGGRPKSPFYGIWNVDQISIDGQVRSPLLNDYGRWRRVIFDLPTAMAFQRMDDSLAGYGTTINAADGTIAMTKGTDKNWKASLHFQRPAQDQLTLDGEMDGHKIHMQLQLFDRNKFLLVNRGFHWVQEFPFNR